MSRNRNRRRLLALELLEDRACPSGVGILAIQNGPNFFPEPIIAGRTETITFEVNAFGGPALTDNFSGSTIDFGDGTVLALDNGSTHSGFSTGITITPLSSSVDRLTLVHTYQTATFPNVEPLNIVINDVTSGDRSTLSGGQAVFPSNSVSPTITSANHATFIVGQNNNFTLTTTGIPAPQVFESGTLPTGVTFVDNHDGTGTLSGTPTSTTGSPVHLTFTARNLVPPNDPATQQFTLTINSAGTAPTITSANNVAFLSGVARTFQVTTTGTSPITLTESGPLPTGVTFHDNGDGTGTLSGTPTGTLGLFHISFTAHNNTQPDAQQPFTIGVDQAPKFTSSTSVSFVNNQPSSFAVRTTGFPGATITDVGILPSGVTFHDNGDGTATISGTPNVANLNVGSSVVFSQAFTATNGISPDATQLFDLRVTSSLSKPVITAPTTMVFRNGQQLSFTATATGNPTPTLTLNLISPLPGLTLTPVNQGSGGLGNSVAAAYGGTPNEPPNTGTVTETGEWVATNSQGTTTLAVTIQILPTVTNQQVLQDLSNARQDLFRNTILIDELSRPIIPIPPARKAALVIIAQTELNATAAALAKANQDINNDPNVTADRTFDQILAQETAQLNALQTRLNRLK